MSDKFSFLYHYLESILFVLDEFTPGIIRCDIIFFDTLEGNIKAKTKNNSIDVREGIAINIEGFIPKINKFRKYKRGFYWFTKSEIPWRIPDFENKKTDLLSKLDVLMIAIENSKTKPLNDLIFLYFHKNLSNLRMDTGTNDITMRERDLVGKSYESSINAMIALAKSDINVWYIVTEQFKNTVDELENQRKEMIELKLKYQESFVDSCNYYLEKISIEQGQDFYFSQGAIEKIKNRIVAKVNMEEAIWKAVVMAKLLKEGDNNSAIAIKDSYLNFKIMTKKTPNEKDVHGFELDKAFIYLNRIEDAIKILKQTKMPVIGQKVAAAMKPSVSKSSITMYVQNHQKDILNLFKLYPDNWKLARSEFKTILNLIANQDIRPGKSNSSN